MIDDPVDFPSAKKGYEPEAVQEHLSALHRAHTEELRSRDREITELRALVASARERQEAVHMTLVAASRARDEMLASAQTRAEEIVASAQMEAAATLKEAKLEAFRLVTEAREDAAVTLDEATKMRDAVPDARAEAATIAEQAQAQASQIVAEARREAMRMIAEAEATASSLEDERVAELRMHRDALADEAAALEAEVSHLRARVGELGAEQAATRGVAPDRHAVATSYAKTRFAAAPVTEPEAAPLHDTNVVVAAIPLDTDVETPTAAPAPRGSFYSRRSANLPRIGDESGRNALTSMAGLRGHVNATTFGEEEEGEHRRDRDDLAIQPASA